LANCCKRNYYNATTTTIPLPQTQKLGMQIDPEEQYSLRSGPSQRHELDVAQQASMLQQKIWSEFKSLPLHEQTAMLEKAP